MIQFVENKDINFEKWDQCIDQSLNGIIYPYSFYLDQVAPGWAALVLDDYQAVMPLPVKKKAGWSYIYQPFFLQQLGVFSPAPLAPDMVKKFIEHIPSRFRFINYNLNIHNRAENIKGAKLIKHTTYELDLISPYSILQKNYSSNTLRNLKKAAKNKIFVTPASDPEIIIESFRRYRGKSIKNLGEAQYNTLKHLIHSGIYRGNARAYTAWDAQNNFCAGVVFLYSHKKTILIFSGSTPPARENGAMTAIIDQFIKDYSEHDLTLDFEGSDNRNLARFYSGFGSKECVYLQVLINNFPRVLKPMANFYYFAKNYWLTH